MGTKTLIHMSRALILKRTLGLKVAAGFCRNRDVPFAEALFILTGSRREMGCA